MTNRATFRVRTLHKTKEDYGIGNPKQQSIVVDLEATNMHFVRVPMQHGDMGLHDRDGDD